MKPARAGERTLGELKPDFDTVAEWKAAVDAVGIALALQRASIDVAPHVILAK